MKAFLPNAGCRYTKDRNFDLGLDSRDNLSRLSPYLRHRLILETDVLKAVLAVHPWPAPEKFIREVFWRTDFEDWLSALLDVAQQHGVSTIVTAYAPVGPVADRLAAIEPGLKSSGINLVRLQRPYDTLCWRHSTRGFFQLKSKIPSILERLDGLGETQSIPVI